MYYTSSSASDSGGGVESIQRTDQQQSSSLYVPQEQQHFVVISNNNSCVDENNLNRVDDGGVNVHQQLSVSCRCSCASGYTMSCDSVNCINKYQRHDNIHLPQDQQHQIVVTTSGEQLVSYSMPMSHMPEEHDHQTLQESFHEISQSINQVTNSVADLKPVIVNQQVDEKELRRQRLAEMARLRYQNLSKEEKKAVNSRRMLLRKRKRQREREMEELEAILRSSNDIEEDVVFIGELREKRQRESRARAARSRYHSMTPEERRSYNQKRRMRQLGLLNGNESVDSELIKEQIAQQNARKAELARQRYHRMSLEERKIYNKRRTESLRRRRMEEEALLATPAGQIDSDALLRAQQIMTRNAVRAEKARERYKRRTPTARDGRRRQPRIKQEQSEFSDGQGASTSRPRNNSGDVLSVIEREVERRTLEARQVLEQKARTIVVDPQHVQHIKEETNLNIHHLQHQQHQPEIINLCPVGVSHSLGHNNHIQPNAPFPTQTIVHASPASANVGGGAVVMPPEVKPATKYVSYMQLPAGTTQSGFLLADGQFVALQEPIQSYAIEQPAHGFDNNFHINPAAVLRNTGNQPSAPGQPIIIGQRVELINAGDHQVYHPQHVAPAPNTIHVVNYSGAPMQQHQQQQIQHHHAQPPQQHIISQHLTQQQHTLTQHSQQPQQLYTTIQPQHNPHNIQQQQIHMIPSTATTSSNISVDPQIDDKLQVQRAKRAERARRRYHEMSAEARHEFNAKRALALKMSRLKDEELCRLGDKLDMTNREADEELRRSIEQARIRRSKRAETARQKYQKMTPEQRKIHNAMRDAQRRQRKREIEEDHSEKQ